MTIAEMIRTEVKSRPEQQVSIQAAPNGNPALVMFFIILVVFMLVQSIAIVGILAYKVSANAAATLRPAALVAPSTASTYAPIFQS
jgi:hypothetical protein